MRSLFFSRNKKTILCLVLKCFVFTNLAPFDMLLTLFILTNDQFNVFFFSKTRIADYADLQIRATTKSSVWNT